MAEGLVTVPARRTTEKKRGSRRKGSGLFYSEVEVRNSADGPRPNALMRECDLTCLRIEGNDARSFSSVRVITGV